jgi:hypothetical protein
MLQPKKTNSTIDRLMWQSMAGVAQFGEGVDIVLPTADKLLDATGS